MSRLHAMNSEQTSDIFCLDRTGKYDNIFNYHVSMLIRKNHQLYDKINDIVSYSFEAGLFYKWTRDSQYNMAHKHIEQSQPSIVQLRMEHIAGAIIAYISFGLLSTLALIIEFNVIKHVMVQNPTRLWMFTHKMLNSERHGTMELINEVSNDDVFRKDPVRADTHFG